MRGPMNWKDSVKATALATLAQRTTPPARVAAGAAWTWNAHDVWLTRIQPPRALAVLTSERGPSSPPRVGNVLSD